jgi:hypothetical protein
VYEIAFDVGVKNLAYAISKEGVILEGKVMDISAETLSGMATNVVDIINEISLRFPHYLVNGFFIEKQLSFISSSPYNQGILYYITKACVKNKSIESMIHTAAISKSYLPVEYTKPRLGKGRQQNKKATIVKVNEIINESAERITIQVKEYYLGLKKKDDLAECMLKLWNYQ